MPSRGRWMGHVSVKSGRCKGNLAARPNVHDENPATATAVLNCGDSQLGGRKHGGNGKRNATTGTGHRPTKLACSRGKFYSGEDRRRRAVSFRRDFHRN